MRRLIALTVKEFRQLSRDHLTLRMIVMVPLMQMTIFGYAINFDVKHLPMVVLDESRSYESREFVARMQASQYFDLIGGVSSMDELRRALDSAQASVALVIDRDFGKDRRRNQSAHALLIVNASDSTTSTQAMSVAAGIANTASMQQLAVQARWRERELPVDLRGYAASGLPTRTMGRSIEEDPVFFAAALAAGTALADAVGGIHEDDTR